MVEYRPTLLAIVIIPELSNCVCVQLFACCNRHRTHHRFWLSVADWGACLGNQAMILFTAFNRNLIKGGILSGVTRKSEEWEKHGEPEGTEAFIKSAIDARTPQRP